jgi:hypothetical protein
MEEKGTPRGGTQPTTGGERLFGFLAGYGPFLACFRGFLAFFVSSQTLQSLQSGVEMRARFVRQRAHERSK